MADIQSNTGNAAAVAPALEEQPEVSQETIDETPETPTIPMDKIFTAYSEANSRPRLLSTLNAANAFVSRICSRKLKAANYANLSESEQNTWENSKPEGVSTLKDYFAYLNKAELYIGRKPEDFQSEMRTIRNNWNAVSKQAIKGFRKMLQDINEQREPQDVFNEVFDFHLNNTANHWSALLRDE